jgi:pyridoxal phosphate enzyme (YggS family)
MRAASLNSQSGGKPIPETRFTVRAQVINAASMPDPTTIAQNLASIGIRIAVAAKAAGRDPAGISLIAVSKTHPREAVLQAFAAGQILFGENRVQEAAQKFPVPGARLHLIGPLQTNKAAQAVRLADSIDSLDREKLSDTLAAAADAAGRLPNLLVQINIGAEPQKSGVALGDADGFIRAARQRFGSALKGLMCIPPVERDPAPYFKQLAAMADAHGLAVRSMGMSGDFEAAIAAGATHLRIGTAIFGHRPRGPGG